MRRRLMGLAIALVVVGASPLLMASRASADPVQTQADTYRCHGTVTVEGGHIVGSTALVAQVATGYGLCLRNGETYLVDRIELSGMYTRDGVSPGPAEACPRARYSFDSVRLWSSYFVNRTQEWREITSENSSVPSPQVIGVFANSASKVPQGIGVTQKDQNTCAGWPDQYPPGFTTTVDWTFTTGYPFSGPPPDGLLGLCVTEYYLVPIPQTCIKI